MCFRPFFCESHRYRILTLPVSEHLGGSQSRLLFVSYGQNKNCPSGDLRNRPGGGWVSCSHDARQPEGPQAQRNCIRTSTNDFTVTGYFGCGAILSTITLRQELFRTKRAARFTRRRQQEKVTEHGKPQRLLGTYCSLHVDGFSFRRMWRQRRGTGRCRGTGWTRRTIRAAWAAYRQRRCCYLG